VGRRLPRDLTISSAPFFSFGDQVSNVWIGDFENRETVVFDFHANHGDVGYKQTVVAVKSQCKIPSMSTLWTASEIHCLSLGAWIIMYRERAEIHARNLKEFLHDCSEMMRYIESKQQEL
jgi:hypothetical protein